jgi:hypothetical protein
MLVCCINFRCFSASAETEKLLYITKKSLYFERTTGEFYGLIEETTKQNLREYPVTV